MAFPSNLLYMNGQPTELTRRAYSIMDKMTDHSGVFGTEYTLTPFEEEAFNILMDIFPKWRPGDSLED